LTAVKEASKAVLVHSTVPVSVTGPVSVTLKRALSAVPVLRASKRREGQ